MSAANVKRSGRSYKAIGAHISAPDTFLGVGGQGQLITPKSYQMPGNGDEWTSRLIALYSHNLALPW